MTTEEKFHLKFSLFFAFVLICLLALSGIALPWVISSELPIMAIIILVFLLIGTAFMSIIMLFVHLKLSIELRSYFKCVEKEKAKE